MADYFVAKTGSDANAGTFGSPVLTFGKGASLKGASDNLYIKYDPVPYDISSSTANVTNGRASFAPASDAALGAIIGYDTNATPSNTDANRPTIRLTVGSCSAITLGGYQIECRNLIVDGNSQTASTCFDNTGGTYGSRFVNCKAINFTAAGFLLAGGNGCSAIECEASSGTSAATAAFNVTGIGTLLFGCTARSNACPGFYGNGNHGILFERCVADSNSGASSDGFLIDGGTSSAIGCTVYNSGRSGFRAGSYMRTGVFIDCLSYGNAAYGFDASGAGDVGVYLRNCAYGSNTSGNTTLATTVVNQSPITLSADPFTSKSTGDLSLNTTAGGGAACRAAGFPGVFPGGLTTGYVDVGGAQHADPVGGSSIYAIDVQCPVRINTYRTSGY